MKTINSYLTFNGNCREAMQFYKECLGGELFIQPVAGSPLTDQLPEQMKNSVLHSTLTTDHVVLMGTDMVADDGLITGNAVSLMIDCSSEEEINYIYNKLSNDGKTNHPLELTFWGALFGDVTDRYGNHWLLHFQKVNNTTEV